MNRTRCSFRPANRHVAVGGVCLASRAAAALGLRLWARACNVTAREAFSAFLAAGQYEGGV